MTVVINGTTGITSVNGSSAAPSVTGTDTDTGIVYGTNTLSLATGGTTAVTVDSSQNVGIGTSSTTGYWPSNLTQAAARTEIVYTDSSTNLDNANAGLVILNNSSTGGTSSKLVFGANNSDPVPVALAYISAVNATRATGYLSAALVFGAASTSSGTGPVERMRIDSSGNVGIGTSSPSYKLHVSGSGSVYGLITNTGTGPSNLYLGAANAATQIISRDATTGAVPTVFLQGTSESMRIDSSGNLLVGTTSALSANGTSVQVASSEYPPLILRNKAGTAGRWYGIGPGNSTSDAFYIMNGSQTAGVYLSWGASSWTGVSDRRLKENIEDINYGLDAVLAIKPRRFAMKADGVSTVGFIAQELKEVIPEAVVGEEIAFAEEDTPQDRLGKTMGVTKELIIPVLVKAIQEQQAIIEQLKADVAELKAAK